ncbi:hypothetical protein CSOJ01_13355 [Colletotrichum sojae]|uniref:Uncharacterized protein n=1 Tax=Colletotrichum sojae TaxID=2175907 RepID=A0A8H6MKF9_9PEZI|nr:hypothetical protein CSOJ01_13355 [Colletotrichum sojae]
MWGTPTPYTTGNGPSGACFPPNWTVSGGYRTDGDCPWGYRRACASGRYKSGQPPTSYITTAPALGIFLFECTKDVYGCVATFSTYHQVSGVLTNIWIPTLTEVPTIRSSVGGESMAAWGIRLVRVSRHRADHHRGNDIATGLPGATTTRPSDSSSPTLATEEDNSSSALSTGAVAGIAVGTGAFVALIAIVAFLIYRHRRKRETNHQQYYNAFSPGQETGEFASPGSTKGPPVHEAPDTGPNNGNREAWELRG